MIKGKEGDKRVGYATILCMTIDAIFERYEVPRGVQVVALLRGSHSLLLSEAWVGPAVTWQVVVKALVFADLGEQGAHIRKKVGLDKYTTTLIARGHSKFVDAVARSHDLYQKLCIYCMGLPDLAAMESVEHRDAWEHIVSEIERNLLHTVVPPTVLSPEHEAVLRSIDILHYKNPSV